MCRSQAEGGRRCGGSGGGRGGRTASASSTPEPDVPLDQAATVAQSRVDALRAQVLAERIAASRERRERHAAEAASTGGDTGGAQTGPVNVADSGFTPLQVGRVVRGQADLDPATRATLEGAIGRARAAAEQARSAAEQGRGSQGETVNIRADNARVGMHADVITGDVTVHVPRRRQ